MRVSSSLNVIISPINCVVFLKSKLQLLDSYNNFRLCALPSKSVNQGKGNEYNGAQEGKIGKDVTVGTVKCWYSKRAYTTS